MGRVSEVCAKRGILLKPFFDDAAQVRARMQKCWLGGQSQREGK
jgi:hypothetical protein